MELFLKEIKQLNIGKVKENELLSNHTTIKIGGPADIFVEPASIEGLEELMKRINKYHIPWRVIGRGSNLLVSDKGIEGVVIKLGSGIDHIVINGPEITVGGGHSLVSLATMLSKKGYTGLEFASGIPGSVGGAVYMNAGAHGSDFSKILKKAKVLFSDGTIEWLNLPEMRFSYRTSVLQKERPGIVLEAVLNLPLGEKENIIAVMQKNKDYRKETQPWNFPCAGSIFRNPLPNYAGKLVEVAGLKGYAIGGAKISDLHGNFIVNAGNATANDVLALIQHVKETIYELYEIKMETEVEIIGRK